MRKIFNVRREYIREINFTKSVYYVSFLDEEGDILVGNYGKISMVSCDENTYFKKKVSIYILNEIWS